jgi:hypothetical protein
MKTTFIILALMCTDYEQDMHCYKAVVQRPKHEQRSMCKEDLMCDTVTVYTNTPYEVGDKISLNNETNK